MQARRPLRARLAPVLAAVLIPLCASCGDDEPTPEELAAADLARERAAAYFQKPADDSGLLSARTELAPLVADDDALVEDLVRAAAVEFALVEPERAKQFARRALDTAPADPAANFLAGQLAYEEGRVEEATEHFERVLERAPDDLPTRLRLGSAYEDLERYDEAEGLYRGILDRGIEYGGDWYVAALYRLIQLSFVTGKEEQAQELLAVREELEDSGIEAPSQKVVLRGNFGVLTPPAREGTTPLVAEREERWTTRAVEPGSVPGAVRQLAVHDLEGDGTGELCVATDEGLFVLEEAGDALRGRRLVPGAFDLVRALDLDNDGDLDLLTFEGAQPRMWMQADGVFSAREVSFPELPSAPRDATVVDFDHEGDVDLLLAGDFGAGLWRNDGAWVEDGAFADATETATLPTDRAFTWCAAIDLDTDQDVDLLLGGPDGAYLADSLRAGRFADRTSRLTSVAALVARPALGDVDGDARPDLVLPGDPCRLLRQRPDLGFTAEDLEAVDAGPLFLADLDGDLAYDLVGREWLDFAFAVRTEAPTALAPDVAAGTDLAPLVAHGAAFGERLPALHRAATDADGLRAIVSGAWLPADTPRRVLKLVGTRDNHRAVGATVELRAGSAYRRIDWRGEPTVIAAAGRGELDVLRITWTNGVVQPYVDVALQPEAGEDALLEYEQNAALVGSCPFLYTWNGERYEFVSDVLGATPLGLPIAPGRYVQPDHDEYVLVTAEQLAPNEDGELVLQFTEELREVTYLDRATLIAVDHPADTAVYPNELFCFPPFPEHHLHSVADAHAPLSARGSDGTDWTAALAEQDDVHAVPFERLPHQFSGMAKPWFLELAFDPERAKDAKGLRLVMTGWFDWSDASANMAAARTPGVDFVPPLFQVPDGEGGWRDVGPPHGFPAGKTKTMVVDASAWLDPEDPRVRVFSTLQLYWDRIALATCGDDAPRTRTELDPVAAQLWQRGFSEPIEATREDLPERFDWQHLAEFPRWNQHPGRYTELGDCLPLLGAVDDRFAILGAGDCLTLRFDASELPPLADGWRRDWLVFLDGWAKDRDHNATDVLAVEPMPFHGMSGFPYGEDESFPDTPEHRRWRAEWNTRPAREWIAPVSIRRLGERYRDL